MFRSVPTPSRSVRPGTAGATHLADVVRDGRPETLRAWSARVPGGPDRAAQVAGLSPVEMRALVDLLDRPAAVDLLGSLAPYVAAELVEVVDPAVGAGLVAAVDPAQAAGVLRALAPEDRADVLAAAPVARAAAVRGLLAWPRGSVGARMHPDVVTVDPGQSVAEAVAGIREQRAAAHAAGEVYVTAPDPGGPAPVLLGALSYRDVALAPPDRAVGDVMRAEVAGVPPTADQEAAAEALRARRGTAVPVVDEGRLLGVVTAADVADIVAEEATEDAVRQGGALPLAVPYLRASPAVLWRRRIVWMLALFAAEMYTGTVLRAFEDELATVIALAFFVPLLIGTGGNAGTQVTTTLVRAMAVGQVRTRDVGRVLLKEVAAGTMTAATIAVAGLLLATVHGVGGEVAATVGVAAGVIVLWSTVLASVLPLLLRRLRVDPAVVSGPMITTLVDGTGLILYFTVARLLISALGA